MKSESLGAIPAGLAWSFGSGSEFMNILQPPNAVFFIGLVVQFVIRHHFIQRTKSEKKTVRQVDRIEKVLLAAVLPTALLLPPLYCFTPLLSFADYDLASSIRWAGAVIMVASLWLFWRSHVDLGQNWSVSLELRENHQLVSHGVYRWVRHPMYASIWLWGLAQGMMLANWFAGWAVDACVCRDVLYSHASRRAVDVRRIRRWLPRICSTHGPSLSPPHKNCRTIGCNGGRELAFLEW